MTIAEPLPTPNQDPTADGFIMRLRKKNTDSKSHKATVDSYFSYWDVDRNSLEDTSSGIKKRRGGSDKLTNHFYDLVTDFYEYGWGTSFHFAPMFKDSSFMQCMSRHEDFLALKLGLKENQVCLDVRSIIPRRMKFFNIGFMVGWMWSGRTHERNCKDFWGTYCWIK